MSDALSSIADAPARRRILLVLFVALAPLWGACADSSAPNFEPLPGGGGGDVTIPEGATLILVLREAPQVKRIPVFVPFRVAALLASDQGLMDVTQATLQSSSHPVFVPAPSTLTGGTRGVLPIDGVRITGVLSDGERSVEAELLLDIVDVMPSSVTLLPTVEVGGDDVFPDPVVIPNGDRLPFSLLARYDGLGTWDVTLSAFFSSQDQAVCKFGKEADGQRHHDLFASDADTGQTTVTGRFEGADDTHGVIVQGDTPVDMNIVVIRPYPGYVIGTPVEFPKGYRIEFGVFGIYQSGAITDWTEQVVLELDPPSAGTVEPRHVRTADDIAGDLAASLRATHTGSGITRTKEITILDVGLDAIEVFDDADNDLLPDGDCEVVGAEQWRCIGHFGGATYNLTRDAQWSSHDADTVLVGSGGFYSGVVVRNAPGPVLIQADVRAGGTWLTDVKEAR